MRTLVLAALAVTVALPAQAALAPGAKAPDFATQGALAGKLFPLRLRAALRKGPVVLYFFPAAFTPGCSAEARAFAEATADFHAAGATVIGMSADPIDKLRDFSTKDCANRFAVASATPAIVDGYDVRLARNGPDGAPVTRTNRTSYVIAPDGRILLAFSDMNPADHVRTTLAAVREYRAKHPHG